MSSRLLTDPRHDVRLPAALPGQAYDRPRPGIVHPWSGRRQAGGPRRSEAAGAWAGGSGPRRQAEQTEQAEAVAPGVTPAELPPGKKGKAKAPGLRPGLGRVER